MKTILFLIISVVAFAQEPRWVGSFANDGPEAIRGAVGRRTQGMALYQASVCSGDAAIILSEGLILQAANKNGLVIFSAAALSPLIERVQARSLAALTADAGEALTLGGAAVSTSGVIKMNDAAKTKWTFGLVLATGLFHWLAGKLSGAALSSEQVKGYTLPASVSLAAHQDCWRGLVLGLPGVGATFTVN